MNWDEAIKTMEGWHFGGKGSGIEDSLLQLVLDGTKTATCSWREAYAIEDDPLPVVGERTYILNSADKPMCVVETVDVVIKGFNDVDAEFAYAEGEGDRSYAYWRRAHEDFFSNYGRSIGLDWDSETQSVVCERFRVVHRF